MGGASTHALPTHVWGPRYFREVVPPLEGRTGFKGAQHMGAPGLLAPLGPYSQRVLELPAPLGLRVWGQSRKHIYSRRGSGQPAPSQFGDGQPARLGPGARRAVRTVWAFGGDRSRTWIGRRGMSVAMGRGRWEYSTYLFLSLYIFVYIYIYR